MIDSYLNQEIRERRKAEIDGKIEDRRARRIGDLFAGGKYEEARRMADEFKQLYGDNPSGRALVCHYCFTHMTDLINNGNPENARRVASMFEDFVFPLWFPEARLEILRLINAKSHPKR